MIVFDLEGTLSINKNRIQYLPDYEKFHKHFPEDELYLPMAKIIRAHSGMKMILTGMMQKHRPMAEKWLKKNNIEYQLMIMRPDNDFSPSPDFKTLRLLDWRDRMGFTIDAVYDDRKDIVDQLKLFEFNSILVEQII